MKKKEKIWSLNTILFSIFFFLLLYAVWNRKVNKNKGNNIITIAVDREQLMLESGSASAKSTGHAELEVESRILRRSWGQEHAPVIFLKEFYRQALVW